MTQCDSAICPCGSGQSYARCCGPYLQGRAYPSTAAALMRSRYTAYVLGETPYLRKSWATATCPSDLSGLRGPGAIKWLGLKIRQVEGGGDSHTEGMVEFVARYKIQGKAYRMHERSRFVREAGRWVYLDGEQR